MDITYIVQEWSYRLDSGMPDINNPKHISVLKSVLYENNYPDNFIDHFITFIFPIHFITKTCLNKTN